MSSLQFAPWSSDIDLAFYAALASIKINHDRLNDSARKLLGLYEIRASDTPERSARMQILTTALTSDEYACCAAFPDPTNTRFAERQRTITVPRVP
jgi:ubiquitin-like modifier-activating enzyme ATG7